MGKYIARATYSDGSEIEKEFPESRFPHMGGGDIEYMLEEWLISRQDGCEWYSVNYEWGDEEVAPLVF